VADLAAFREDREQPALVVEVLESHALQRPFAQPVVEEQPESKPVAQLGIASENRCTLVGGERRAIHGALLRPLDGERRVAVQVSAENVEFEELMQDAQCLVVSASRTGAPLVLQELLQALGADGRLKIYELQVGEVARELVKDALVVAVRGFREPLALGAQVMRSLSAERQRAIGLVFHRCALQLGDEPRSLERREPQ
jgi:hypothetical protein